MNRQLTVYERPGMPEEPKVGTHKLLSSERNDWQTPPEVMGLVRSVIGDVFFDPATSSDNPTFADQFCCVGPPGDPYRWAAACGLEWFWPTDMPGFINSPWGAHLSGNVDPGKQIWRKGRCVGVGTGWAQKIASHPGEWLCVVPNRPSAAWWRTIQRSADVELRWGSETMGARLAFINPDTGKPQKGSTVEVSIFYRGPSDALDRSLSIERFRRVFGPHGTLAEGGRAW